VGGPPIFVAVLIWFLDGAMSDIPISARTCPLPSPPPPHLTFFNISHPFLSSKTAISVFSPTWPAGQLSVIDCACACLSFIASEKREARSAEIRPAKKRQECRFEHCFATIALEERKGENGVETRARRDAKRARRRCRDV